jgi:hypothetical protein
VHATNGEDNPKRCGTAPAEDRFGKWDTLRNSFELVASDVEVAGCVKLVEHFAVDLYCRGKDMQLFGSPLKSLLAIHIFVVLYLRLFLLDVQHYYYEMHGKGLHRHSTKLPWMWR